MSSNLATPLACVGAVAALLLGSGPALASPAAQPPAPPEKPKTEKVEKTAPREPTLLDKLYQWIWPLGRYEGDLAKAAVESTSKGERSGSFPRLYRVDVTTGEVAPWAQGGGAVDPVVCPGLDRLVFRRGGKLFTQKIQVSEDGLRELGPPAELAGVKVVQLFACIHDAEKRESLAIQPPGGDLAWLRLTAEKAAPAPPPPLPEPELAGAPLGEMLRNFVSLRPDGYQAYVSQKTLLGIPPGETQARALTGSPVRFSGTPAWVGRTRFLLVTGAEP